MAGVTCECGGATGFANLGTGAPESSQWWVHTACGKPTEPWLRAQGEDVLNFFKGGPLNGTAYTTSSLLTSSSAEQVAWAGQLLEYRWTPEVVVSPTTGASARVWLHSSEPDAEPVPVESRVPVPAPPAAAGPPSPASPQEGADMAAKKKTAAAAGTLEDRRKASKISRSQVSEATGLTAGAVYRIEKGVSPKTTQEEIDAYVAGLEALEAANGA